MDSWHANTREKDFLEKFSWSYDITHIKDSNGYNDYWEVFRQHFVEEAYDFYVLSQKWVGLLHFCLSDSTIDEKDFHWGTIIIFSCNSETLKNHYASDLLNTFIFYDKDDPSCFSNVENILAGV